MWVSLNRWQSRMSVSVKLEIWQQSTNAFTATKINIKQWHSRSQKHYYQIDYYHQEALGECHTADLFVYKLCQRPVCFYVIATEAETMLGSPIKHPLPCSHNTWQNCSCIPNIVWRPLSSSNMHEWPNKVVVHMQCSRKSKKRSTNNINIYPY